MPRFADVGYTLNFIMRPIESIKEAVAKSQKDMGWSLEDTRPVLGVHVRAGDSCTGDSDIDVKKRSCLTLEDYMPYINNITSKYDIKRIFLATDGGKAITSSTKKYPQFEWYYSDGRGDTFAVEKQVREKTADAITEAHSAIVDIELLSMTDALVLKLTSNFDRAVLELTSGRRGCVSPYISLDSPWCFGYGAPEQVKQSWGGWSAIGHGVVSRGKFKGRYHLC